MKRLTMQTFISIRSWKVRENQGCKIEPFPRKEKITIEHYLTMLYRWGICPELVRFLQPFEIACSCLMHEQWSSYSELHALHASHSNLDYFSNNTQTTCNMMLDVISCECKASYCENSMQLLPETSCNSIFTKNWKFIKTTFQSILCGVSFVHQTGKNRRHLHLLAYCRSILPLQWQ